MTTIAGSGSGSERGTKVEREVVDFQFEDIVTVTKKGLSFESLSNGKQASIVDPDWENVLRGIQSAKVKMLECGTVKSFLAEDLAPDIPRPKVTKMSTYKSHPDDFSKNQYVRIVKDSSLRGSIAYVVQPGWQGKVKVCMVTGPHADGIKAYTADQLEIHEEQEIEEEERSGSGEVGQGPPVSVPAFKELDQHLIGE